MSFSPKIPPTSPSELRHGVQYLSREKQPSMFQILSWQRNPIESNQWLLKLQPNYTEPKFTEPPKYEKPQKHASQQEAKIQYKKDEKRDKPHKVLHQLYYYGEEVAKDKKGQGITDIKKEGGVKQKERAAKKLDQFNEFQKRQIDRRKKNIQRFACDTRDLPDSAFTTYFGKPAFATYGIGSNSDSITNRKSHSVMPHAGSNQPLFVQSHEGALSKANVINLNLIVPKRPAFSPQPQDCRVNVSEYYNVEIVKPDLVNQVKFANEEVGLKRKQKTPKHNETNLLPKRTYVSPTNGDKTNKKGKKVRVNTQEKEDGLSFMHRREHFRKEMEQKKKNQNRIAYKPTECYPLDWDNQTAAQSTHRLEKWKQLPPAGVSSERYLKAQSFWHA